MWAERVVGRDGLRDQVGALWLDASVDVLSIVAVREAVERAIAHRRHVVGHEVTAQLIAFVHRDPQRACVGLPREPDGVAQSAREDTVHARRWIDFPDGRTSFLLLDAVL